MKNAKCKYEYITYSYFCIFSGVNRLPYIEFPLTNFANAYPCDAYLHYKVEKFKVRSSKIGQSISKGQKLSVTSSARRNIAYPPSETHLNCTKRTLIHGLKSNLIMQSEAKVEVSSESASSSWWKFVIRCLITWLLKSYKHLGCGEY